MNGIDSVVDAVRRSLRGCNNDSIANMYFSVSHRIGSFARGGKSPEWRVYFGEPLARELIFVDGESVISGVQTIIKLAEALADETARGERRPVSDASEQEDL